VPLGPQTNPVLSAQPGDGQARLTWITSPGATAYYVYIKNMTAAEARFTKLPQPVPGPSWTAGGLVDGDTYQIYLGTTKGVTEGVLSNTVSVTPVTTPGAPTGVVATPGNASATVRWSPPPNNGGSPITGYTVTASPGGQTGVATPPLTTATVTGLTNGVAYTFTVTASSVAGASLASLPSVAVTPNPPPDAPTGVRATAGDLSATVTWSEPASNGGPIRGYTVTAAPGGQTATTTGATTATVTGLTNGSLYTFTVTAANATGTSPASAASGAVMPTAPGFTGMTPARVLDTRIGLGALKAKLGAGRTLTLTVPHLPVGTTAVALNVTVTNPTAGGFLTVYPAGKLRPGVSNLNYLTGQTIPNMVLVPLGPGNTLTFYNSAGTVDVIADIMGYCS
jgi:hypothetical protein